MDNNPSLLLTAALSFSVALTGAMSPGPLLTYTIARSAATPRRGYLVGAWVITGHALAEAFIVLVLLAGFSSLLKSPAVVKAIGISGGAMLVWLGLSLIRDRNSPPAPTVQREKEKTAVRSGGALDNPFVGGALVSMANPYWWIWWATIGAAFMTNFGVSAKNPGALAAFFLGHEAGDLAWYLAVSMLSFWGIQNISGRAYSWIMGGCGLFLAGFGVYLGISPFA